MIINIIPRLLLLVAKTAAHSWLHCTAHNNTDILPEMQKAASETPYREIDPLMPWFASVCHGWPRSKQNPGDWVDESTNYIWDLSLAASKSDTHACHPSQRTPTYFLTPTDSKLRFHSAPAPMATSRPGAEIKLMFGGNGHSRGDNVGGDPGRVSVYWKGEVEAEITDVSEFTEENKVQENGFAEESFAWPADRSVTKPPTLRDKGNWMTLKL